MRGSEELAVIFDMDGVILDTEPLSMRAWIAAASEIGYQLTEQHCYDMIGLGARESKAYITAQVPGAGDVDQLAERANANYLALSSLEAVPCKAGLWELLEFLNHERISKAIATSTPTGLAQEKLRRSQVLEHFDIVVGGDQVRRGKPAPDIYRLAADRLGRSPSSCIVLEDSGPGLRAAASAGMRPIFIPDMCRVDEQTQQLAMATAASLLEVISLLRETLD
jgi:beta-phosphoglucomutase-like phosphatase (HAD superfamily)